MSQELLKAWVHNVLQNPIDDHQLAHANATKDLLEENARYIERIEELTSELSKLKVQADRHREALDKAEKALKFYRREFD